MKPPREEQDRYILPWIVWGLSCLFLFYEYFLRTAPSVIVVELVEEFKASAAAIGALSAFYFYIYAPMQLPVGMLMDRFGARRLLTIATFLCGAGAIFFGFASDYWMAAWGRVLMGFGSAFAFIGMVYVSSHWFHGNKLSLLVGIGNSIASLGAAVGQGPMADLVQVFGWRPTIVVIGIFGILIAIVMYWLLRHAMPTKPPGASKSVAKPSMWQNLRIVTSSGQTWINAIVALLCYATTNAFAGLWGVPFLYHTHHMSEEAAGYAVSMIFIGWIFGGPLVGLIADHLGERRFVLRFCMGAAFVMLVPIIAFQPLPIWSIFVLMFLVGFFSSGQLLNFALAIQINPMRAKGTATAFTNFLISATGAAVQPLVGEILDLLAPDVKTVGGLPVYTVHEFRFTLSIFPIMMFLAFVLSFFIKRPKPKGEHPHPNTPPTA